MPTRKQDQRSQQSANNPADSKRQQGAANPAPPSRTGIGSSQGQDGGVREERPPSHIRTGEGTADIERGSAGAESGSDSLVEDPTGAFKERP
jgi:hypothetical protein